MNTIEINPAFARALERIASGGRNLFITGKAGTGKSTLLEYYRANAAERPVILAPTGVAALQVGGETVHRFFGFGIDVTPEKVRKSRRKPRRPEVYKKLRDPHHRRGVDAARGPSGLRGHVSAQARAEARARRSAACRWCSWATSTNCPRW